MLATRLARRGVLLSGGMLAVVFARNEVLAAVPPALVISTTKAAALATAGKAALGAACSAEVVSITEGVLKAMWITKLKLIVALFVAVGMVSAGAGATGRLARAGGQSETPAAAAPAQEIKKADDKKETAPKENPIALSPDGSFQVAAEGNVLTLTETKMGKILWKAKYHKDTVTAVIFTRDGKVVYSAGKDAAIYATDAASGKQVLVIKHKGGNVVSLSVSADNKTLISTDADGTVQKWDPATGESIK